MRNILLSTAILLMPVMASAQEEVTQIKTTINFDADGDGTEDKIGILANGCEGDECPVVLFTDTGHINLGYGSVVETGFVSPGDLGVNDPSQYPENVPVIQIDGVLMAFNGEVAYPVADLISKEALQATGPTNEELEWLSSKLNYEVQTEEVFKVSGDLSEKGGEKVYSVFNPSLGNTSVWLIRDANGAEIARGFSQDYPRIYVNGDGLRVISVSQSGLGVMDISFNEEKS